MNASTSVALALPIVALLAPSVATGNPEFHPLGEPPTSGSPYSEAWAVSADGDVVVGEALNAPIRWTTCDARALPLPAGYPEGSALACNANGSVIYGFASTSGPTSRLWRGPSFEVEFVPVCRAMITAASDDGRVMAGNSSTCDFFVTQRDAFAITPTGFHWLTNTAASGAGPNYAFAVTPDGSAVLGTAWRSQAVVQAFRWTESGGIVWLPYPPGALSFANAQARAQSQDGTVIVGAAIGSHYIDVVPVLWSWPAGSASYLGDVYRGRANAVTADGRVIVGEADDRAFIWDPLNGLRPLQTVYAAIGVDFQGWTLTRATGISRDGTVIAGNGIDPDGNGRAWVI